MTQDDVIRLWKEANGWDVKDFQNTLDDLMRFAKLVAEKATEEANERANASWALMCEKMVAFEREACAKVCDELVIEVVGNSALAVDQCSKSIRARGQQ